MEYVYPDYYPEFRCIASACRHNCCIGWEIDIDPETLAYYRGVEGALGERLRRCISWEGEPHFILGEGERCPFLNGENLCDLIIGLGEEHLCGICAEHPRFHNALPGRVESGVGLCCEAAGRLILGKTEKTTLLVRGEQETEDAIVALRDWIITVLQNREVPVSLRVEQMLALSGGNLGDKSLAQWAAFLLTLERLDERWTELLTKLCSAEWDHSAFADHMLTRETEYEQLLVYFIYRHGANAVGEGDFAARCAFAALGYEIITALGAILWQEKGQFSFEDQVELARLFSSEIEYSDENLDILLDELY